MPPSSAGDARGLERVEQALVRDGLLLVQGQAELVSLADLLADKPVTTRGYSWDYVAAWSLADELAGRDGVALIKLFRGRRTLVHSRLWPAVQAVAVAAIARERVAGVSPRQALLGLVESQPGIAGGELRTRLGLDASAFQRHKNALEQRLCLFGRERDDTAAHTHESRWFPWTTSKIALATGNATLPTLAEATAILLAALPRRPAASVRLVTLFPALR